MAVRKETSMSDLTLHVLTLNGRFALQIEPVSEESLRHFSSMMLIFNGELKQDRYCIRAEQRATPELKERVATFVDELSEKYPILNRLKKRICSLPDEQYFLISNAEVDTSREKAALEIYLDALNQTGGDLDRTAELFQKLHGEFDDVAGRFFNTYDMFQPRLDIRVVIGVSDKKQRKCRFCGRDEIKGATFKKVAHAIPEALGNKSVILAEECDTCNKFFGDEIEPSFISYFDIYRVLIGAKGKNGSPHLKFRDGEMLHNGDMAVVVATGMDGEPNSRMSITLSSNSSITPINFYKSLVKIALSVIDSGELKYLTETIRWVRYDSNQDAETPQIAGNIVHNGFSKVPQISIFTRKTDEKSLPHIVAEFRFGSYVYVYIVPFSSKDDRAFASEEEFGEFWRFFTHYHNAKGWVFHNYNCRDALPVNFRVNLQKNGD